MKKEILVKTDGLIVGYENTPLIRDIEIEVRRGEILTLIGPNGAGKSTILKSIAKQLELLGGKVYLDKTDMGKMSGTEVAKKLSVMFTGRSSYELTTCEEVVSSGRYPYTGRLGILSKEDREQVRIALELVHATELASCYFERLSDGQKQRVLLARAICQDPDVIILDEPTSFLDIRHKMELLSILKRLVRERQIAVVMSIHELDLAMKVSDQVACVSGDCIEKCGTPEMIFTGDYISTLYGLENSYFFPEYGIVEFGPIKEKPRVFVIGGGGTGISTYRRLHRQSISFAVGVLQENDADYVFAKAFASCVIATEAYEEITDTQIQKAISIMKECDNVICTLDRFGSANHKNKELLQVAMEWGKL